MKYFNSLESIVNSFCAEMSAKGITSPRHIQNDGILHRFHIEGEKAHKQSGWYVLHSDGIPAGAFGNWKEGITHKWCSLAFQNMSTYEWKQHLHRIDNARKQFNEAKMCEQQQAAKIAAQRWRGYGNAKHNHLYLTKKQILPYCARQIGNRLVLPIVDFDGDMRSLQYISDDGTKYLLSCGAKKGNFIVVQGQLVENVEILLVEGFATGATLAAEFPGACVIAAIDAGNLKPVAVTIRERLPKANITIYADDDRNNPDNPGVTNALEAATAVGAGCVKPKWPKSAPDTLTDFNDLVCWLVSAGVSK